MNHLYDWLTSELLAEYFEKEEKKKEEEGTMHGRHGESNSSNSLSTPIELSTKELDYSNISELATKVSKHWKPSYRNDYELGLCGALIKSGYTRTNLLSIFNTISDYAGDSDSDKAATIDKVNRSFDKAEASKDVDRDLAGWNQVLKVIVAQEGENNRSKAINTLQKIQKIVSRAKLVTNIEEEYNEGDKKDDSKLVNELINTSADILLHERRKRLDISEGDFQNKIEYLIESASKTVVEEPVLVRQLVYSFLSAYTDSPINIGIMAPTSEGKTFPVDEVSNFFPNRDIIRIGSMSPKSLVRDHGILVDADNVPIQNKVNKLRAEIKLLNKDKQFEAMYKKKDELKELLDGAKYLIPLYDKILLFYEPPHFETWAIMKPILSHDHWEIQHPVVVKMDDDIGTKHIVTVGFPTCIFCSAKNEYW
jgi:hypothetical protein